MVLMFLKNLTSIYLKQRFLIWGSQTPEGCFARKFLGVLGCRGVVGKKFVREQGLDFDNQGPVFTAV